MQNESLAFLHEFPLFHYDATERIHLVMALGSTIIERYSWRDCRRCQCLEFSIDVREFLCQRCIDGTELIKGCAEATDLREEQTSSALQRLDCLFDLAHVNLMGCTIQRQLLLLDVHFDKTEMLYFQGWGID